MLYKTFVPEQEIQFDAEVMQVEQFKLHAWHSLFKEKDPGLHFSRQFPDILSKKNEKLEQDVQKFGSEMQFEHDKLHAIHLELKSKVLGGHWV